ncbi:unnamed protein product [Caenorhabditis angaria]|uniref:Uncharacterized protein n=1 Tax=Caenorhabditis angaria TaxID=860376 RepID=A0A9P1I1B7_9PELO|nr:unnamed protein product [Caenorhabditis angaria]
MTSNETEEQRTNRQKRIKALRFERKIYNEVRCLMRQLRRSERQRQQIEEDFAIIYAQFGGSDGALLNQVVSLRFECGLARIEKHKALEIEIKIREEIEALEKLLKRSEKRRQQYEEDFGVMYKRCGEFIENVGSASKQPQNGSVMNAIENVLKNTEKWIDTILLFHFLFSQTLSICSYYRYIKNEL